MSDELDLTPHEVVRGAIDESKSKLRNKLDLESSQGILPFTNEQNLVKEFCRSQTSCTTNR